jgi:hypothetical protein
MASPYAKEYNDILDLLADNDKRIIKDGKELRSQLKSLDPNEPPNAAYVDSMAALGMQRNSLRLEAETLYRVMKPNEKKLLTAPYWSEPKLA